MTTNIADISMDEECIFIKERPPKLKSDQSEKKETSVFCCAKDITQSEHHAAAQDDVQAEYKIIVSRYDYSGEKTVKYNSQTYSVYRRYERPDELVELYVEQRSGS